MLMLISPAKTLDTDTPPTTSQYGQPALLTQSQVLIDVVKKLSPADIAALMKISDRLSLLNYERFHDWQTPFTLDNAKQAIFTFKGDVYTGLDASSLDEEALLWANTRLGILSGLYGLLKPLDLMQPYRLEMGTKLVNDRGANLYAFWGTQITEAINAQLAAEDLPVVVNLASNEYYKAVQPKSLAARIVTPVFKDEKNGTYKIISFYAKKARGLMVRWAIDHRVEDVNDLKGFDSAGYYFSSEDSQENAWVFKRDLPV